MIVPFIRPALAEVGSLPGGTSLSAVMEPSVVRPGTVAELKLTVVLPKGWITYDIEQIPDSVLPTRITLEPARDWAPIEALIAPPAVEGPDISFGNRIVRYFTDSPTFCRRIIFDSLATPGPKRVTGRVSLQLKRLENGKYYLIQNVPFVGLVTVAPSISVEASQPITGEAPKPIPSSIPIDTPPEEAKPRVVVGTTTAIGLTELTPLPEVVDRRPDLPAVPLVIEGETNSKPLLDEKVSPTIPPADEPQTNVHQVPPEPVAAVERSKIETPSPVSLDSPEQDGDGEAVYPAPIVIDLTQGRERRQTVTWETWSLGIVLAALLVPIRMAWRRKSQARIAANNLPEATERPTFLS